MTRLDPTLLERRRDWVARVSALVDQISEWSQAQGWGVERRQEHLEDRTPGNYGAPALAVVLDAGQPLVTPIALLTGSHGRVDVEAIPTLSRVKLLASAGDDWTILTESNVPLRLPWNQTTFTQLARDLLA